MALSKDLQQKVYEFLKGKILKKIDEYNLSDEDSSKPFQYALFTKKGYLAKGFIHGCETALGNWHETIAKIIATENFATANKLQGQNKLKGKITREAQRTSENILSDLDSVKREPNHKSESEEIFNASQNLEQTEDRIQTVDLYLETKDGEEIYFEIKGPKPNKNEMRAAKRDLLEIYAMRSAEGKKVKIYLGMYYNPYYPEEYQRWTCIKFFDKGNDFLIGKDFWDFLGGNGAYEELIDIYEKVGEKIRPVLDQKFKDIAKNQEE
ncbi:MAG: TdeIII family type II restriction endonuclease [Candidatus Peregrinibacteria bacterium]|nr:TdeIII family type II restriction endonuclease [Candidatus Peregrinibacteria bacterium]